ncbi:nibrin isoform X2 [Belonocnema kinseyi]|nr:nibrin isoform X2 [Belonocnema kinseyi]
MGSKYGSTVMKPHGERIKVTTEGTNVENLDIIKFGMQENDYRVRYIPIVVLISSLNESDIQHLQSIVESLDGCIVENWKERSDKVVTHLTTHQAKLGQKVALALVKCIPIVGIEYWEAVQTAVENRRDWPKATEYVLPIKENIVDKGKVSLKPSLDRKTLFNNLTFLFFSISQKKIYKDIVIGAGGKVLMFNPSLHTDLTIFCSNEFVAVYYMIGSNQTEESILDSQRLKTGYEEIGELLRKRKRRMISDSEISLAVLHCSVKQHCNPNHNFKDLLVESKKAVSNNNNNNKKATVYALDTQDLRSKVPSDSVNENIIADTNQSLFQEHGKSAPETHSSLVDSPLENPSGPSGITSIHLDSQESTCDMEDNFASMAMNEKRAEKRNLETFSFARTKKLKSDSGSSLFPVLPKSKSQDQSSLSQRLQASQYLDGSQSIIGTQNLQSSQSSYRSTRELFSPIQRVSQRNSSGPSTSREGKKSKPTQNTSADFMDESDGNEEEVNRESRDKEERIVFNVSAEEKEESQKEERVVSKIRIRSDASLLDESRPQMRVEINLEGKRKEPSSDEPNIFGEPAPKKKRIAAKSNLNDFIIPAGRSDKRKRGDGDSDSGEIMMQKKQQRKINSYNKMPSESSGITIDNENQFVRFVTGLIREESTDSLLERTFGHKRFQKVYSSFPATRVTFQTMAPYAPEGNLILDPRAGMTMGA